MKTHKHHIVPKHAGGTDLPDNLIELTVKEHAEAHRLLWEQHKRWQDYIAWQGLSGRIDREEIIREKLRMANTGRAPWHKGRIIGPRSEETKKKISETMKQKGIKPSKEINKKALEAAHDSLRGKTLSEDRKLHISKKLKEHYANNPKIGKPLASEHKKNIALGLMKPVEYDGVTYSSLKECKEITGLTRHQLIKSGKLIRLEK